MRDYLFIDRYLNALILDIYGQVGDPLQTELTDEVIDRWLTLLNASSALDVGCGAGHAMLGMLRIGIERVLGISADHSDIAACNQIGLDVRLGDFSFLPWEDGAFELVWSRHSLEHSPMPLLTLMEWHRVSSQWLCLIVPSVTAFPPGGRNHYYVLSREQWRSLLAHSDWHIIWEDESSQDFEIRFMCEKRHRREDYT